MPEILRFLEIDIDRTIFRLISIFDPLDVYVSDSISSFIPCGKSV